MESSTPNAKEYNSLMDARTKIDEIVSELKALQIFDSEGKPLAGREIALGVTNLQQARMWLGEAMRVAGLVSPYENDTQVTEGTEK